MHSSKGRVRADLPAGISLRDMPVPPYDDANWAVPRPRDGALRSKDFPTRMQPGSHMMFRLRQLSLISLSLAVVVSTSRGDERSAPSTPTPAIAPARVYGEWRIRVRPDQGPAYNRLIEQSGLPLFREAGGRMVGWWNTLVGDLYEHVTIWEYDDMAAFERAIGILSKDPAFARFVAARDPLLAGEESRFLRLAPGATRPCPARAGPVRRPRGPPRAPGAQGRLPRVHDRAGPGPAQGPWVPPGRPLGRRRRPMDRGHVPLPVRQPGRARAAHRPVRRRPPTRGSTATKVGEFAEEVTTRLLVPAPFAEARAGRDEPGSRQSRLAAASASELAPGVIAAGFADRYHSANCGWVALATRPC